ncbi:transmembrane of CMA family [Micractinium conductrix]|uniref:Transmembrane of CMA family n=1 Tax=Micractinium conductrix TaxID=554055 RepID=A0A2P6V4Q0_9CHLO|nr:transmembrane of CMA family [Micractinium conductrix]|eukprot:PSC69065.1 transmembrane of CMA family [Micractinium conductrix]
MRAGATGQAAKVQAGLIALQIVFGVAIPAVTSTVLDKGSTQCYLNLTPGRVCDFAYVTSGFSLFFSLLLAAGAVGTLRQGPAGFLAPIWGSLGLFAAFWWLVAAITFMQRSKQADGKGLPEGSARDAVVALSWIQAILFFFSFLLVVYDRYAYRQYRLRRDSTRSMLDMEQAAQFKEHYVVTQVGSTPVA